VTCVAEGYFSQRTSRKTISATHVTPKQNSATHVTPRKEKNIGLESHAKKQKNGRLN
jgi:hypothetical protein